MAEATKVGVVRSVGLLSQIEFEETPKGGRSYTYILSVSHYTPGREMITREGQIVEVEHRGYAGSISRVVSVREPEEDVAERVMLASDDQPDL